MFIKKTLLCLMAWSCILGAALAEENKCRECMDNNAYCVSDTEFYICPDGENPVTSGGPNKCADKLFCTNLPEICSATPDTGRPCQTSGSCGSCGAKPGLICAGRTEYAFCGKANDPNPITGSCAKGQVCSMQLYENTQSPKKICAPESVLEFLGYQITCEGEATTSTPGITTTVDPNVLSKECLAKESTAKPNNARYFYIHDPRDENCRSYIYCEKIDGVMQGILFTCPNNGHWDIGTKRCKESKPASCNVTTTTATTTTAKTTTPAARTTTTTT